MAPPQEQQQQQHVQPIRTLLIDNYDSYTFNLFQLLAEVNGAPPTVVHNDALDWSLLLARLEAGEFHNIVISPGPGTPERATDIGVVMQLLRAHLSIPTLGVCLGFQALAAAHGGRVSRAPAPVHGRLSAVEHAGRHPLFQSIPSGPAFQVVRYHSLAVDEAALPACLEPLAWTTGEHHALTLAGDGAGAGGSGGGGGEGGAAAAAAGPRVLMALAHRSLPHWGVQFHPESVATRYGAALLQNFRDLTCAHYGLPRLPPHPRPAGPPGCAAPPRPWEAAGGSLALVHEALPGALEAAGGSEALFLHLFARTARREQDAGAALESSGGSGDGGSSSPTAEEAEDTFWLDSATATDRGRFSFMGGRGGPLWRRVHYRLPCLEERRAHSAAAAAAGGEAGLPPGTLVETDAQGRNTERRTALLPWLRATLARLRCRVAPTHAAALPFDFWGGLVGYWGYELKAECSGAAAHESPLPDAAFFVADRLLALDHLTGTVHVLALQEAGGGDGCDDAAAADAEAEAQAWVAATAAEVRCLCERRRQASQQQQQQQQPETAPQQCQPAAPPFRLREGRAQYLANVDACMAALHAGESYELCLTTELRRRGAPDALALYRTLRAINPAPYAAWLHLGPGAPRLACSSPERFLRGGRGGLLEARPIKGTAPRVRGDAAADAAAAAALAASEKDRAENLMIVDLLRNDLGRVCEPGSVHVPSLMAIESYATMVSTVAGLRRQDASVVDCFAAAFPGGSMTGAPKVRTMAILDGLERGPRGVYSGSIGYLSFNDTFDLNIVIRTAVVTDTELTIGAGGAIVVQSDAQGEYEEMRLKASALLRAVGMCDSAALRGNGEPAAVDEGDACHDGSPE